MTYELDMPEEDYHAHPALSSSGLRMLLRNPARYLYELEHGRPPKDYFDFGSLVHGRVLGKGWGILVWPLDEWRGTIEGEYAKVTAQEFRELARGAGLIPVKAKDVRRAAEIQNAVETHPIAGPLLARPGLTEMSMFWRDRSGVRMRARVDRLTQDDDGNPLLIDVKTTQDASPHAVRQHVARFGYHVQLEFYKDGLVACELDPTGTAEAVLIFVETEPPYPVTVARLDAEAQRIGYELVRRGVQLYSDCVDTGRWPSYVDEEIIVGLPRWAKIQEDL